MSMEQKVFAAIHTALSADATLVSNGIDDKSIHRTSAGRPARVYPYIEVDVQADAYDSAADTIDAVPIRVRIVADAHDAVGTGNTPEAAAKIDTIHDRVMALLDGFSTAITGLAYSTISRVRQYPVATSGQHITRVIDFQATFGS